MKASVLRTAQEPSLLHHLYLVRDLTRDLHKLNYNQKKKKTKPEQNKNKTKINSLNVFSKFMVSRCSSLWNRSLKELCSPLLLQATEQFFLSSHLHLLPLLF